MSWLSWLKKFTPIGKIFHKIPQKFNYLSFVIFSNHRFNVRPRHADWSMTQSYCKREVLVGAAVAYFYFSMYCFAFTVGLVLIPNKYVVPYSYNIPALFDEYNFAAWTANYLHQWLWITSFDITFVSNVAFFYILMSHTCWLIDSALIFIEEFGDELSRGVEHMQADFISTKLRKITDMVEAVQAWQGSVSDSLRLSFCLISVMQYSVTVMFLFSFLSNAAESFLSFISLFVMLLDLFVFCKLGTKVETRLEKLVAALHGINWARLTPRQRKDLCLILTVTQNISSYDCIFLPISLETFQKVWRLHVLIKIYFLFLCIVAGCWVQLFGFSNFASYRLKCARKS